MSLQLNPLTLPLSGTHLIEASAGTGKTWNIAALYTRLVVLEHMGVDKILVVTFTKAATAELKNRLRARLDEALVALLNTENALCKPKRLREECSDGFLFRLLIKALQKEMRLLAQRLPENAETQDSELAAQAQARLELRLKAAIADFDHAAIFTIHGFCQRVLQDFAFYCQVPFQIELDEESRPLYRLIAAQDFWREQIVHNTARAGLVFNENLTPEKQLNQLDNYLSRPYLVFRQPEKRSEDLARLQQDLARAWSFVQPKLTEIEAAFWQLHPNLSSTFYKDESLRQRFAALNGFSGSLNAQDLFNALNQHGKFQGETVDYLPFNADVLQEKKLKNKELNPEFVAQVAQLDDVYHAAQAVVQAEQEALIALNFDFIDYLRQAHEARKKEQPERRFDDLLLDVFNALQQDAAHREALAAAMSAQWHTALIDEFQDTDPLQYQVFRQTFGLAAEREGGKALFLVGDPKQAIYSFRGADIFAYLDAAHDAPESQRYSLDTNHRSHAKLINSIGALFHREKPFALPEIDYPKVVASRAQSRLQPEKNAFVVRWLNEEEKETSDSLGRRAAAWCAAEIAALLQPNAQKIINKQGVAQDIQAKQIAVLVRARKDGATVQRALKAQGVQSVLLSQDSIFAEPEAQAVFALMGFVMNPLQQSLLNFVLSGCLFDVTESELLSLNQDDNAILAWTNLASEAMAIWQRDGIYAALQSVLQNQQVEARLLAQQRERTLTNIQQLLELLAFQDQEAQNPLGLQQWLGAQIQAAHAGKSASNAALLRLESDENLVKIVTMHASKGLQYPIVFCPYAFKASQDNSKDEWHIIHQDEATELVHKTQLNEQDSEKSTQEALSEDLRLWYVALTRAEEQLIVYMGQYDKSYHHAFAYLLDWRKDSKISFQAAWQQFIAAQDKQQTDFVLESGFRLPENTAQAVSGSLKPSTAIYQARTFAPRYFQFVQHTSFTGLARQTERAIEAERADLLPELDPIEQNSARETVAATARGIEHFPAGTQAGVCLHSLLERFRPQQSPEKQRELAEKVLQQYGYKPEEWADIVLQCAHNTVQTPLLPKLNLAMLPESERLDEMGFVFHSQALSVEKLRAWFAQPHLGLSQQIIRASERLTFHEVNGFINGFIDVFAHTAQGETLIIDYKSNYLGDSIAAYHRDALDDAIAQHYYYLQALIYAIAAARYLKSRHVSPKTIAVRYLFLRGLDGMSEHGVWQWDIAMEDLETWLG
ncbi:exodeoxyribonuclease V subunit beta [Neisseriaceae bacterium B1]